MQKEKSYQYIHSHPLLWAYKHVHMYMSANMEHSDLFCVVPFLAHDTELSTVKAKYHVRPKPTSRRAC